MEGSHTTEDIFSSDSDGQPRQSNTYSPGNPGQTEHKDKWIRDRYNPRKNCEHFKGRKFELKNINSKQQSSRNSNRFGSSSNYETDNFNSKCNDDRYLLGMVKDNFKDEVKKRRYIEGKDRTLVADNRDNDYIYCKDHEEDRGENKESPVRLVEDYLPLPILGYNHCTCITGFQGDVQIEDSASNEKEISKDYHGRSYFEIDKRQKQLLQDTTVPKWNVHTRKALLRTPNLHPNDNLGTVSAITSMERFHNSGMSSFPCMSMGKFVDNFGIGEPSNMILDPVKKPVHLTRCVLYPPSSIDHLPTVVGKPLRCCTVLVQGLPERATKPIMQEVFNPCGEIFSICMSKDNCCYITFTNETFVENALNFSGYKMKIKNSAGSHSQSDYIGRLRIDCSVTNFESAQKTESLMEYYSGGEALTLVEKLRKRETFHEAVNVLCTWLEKGQCNKKNASSFYSMIQSTNSHLRRLMNEKIQYTDEMNKAKIKLMQMIESTLLDFKKICKVFDKAYLQKVWAHFTKAQRKNIILWGKQAKEIKDSHIEALLNERVEDDMDVSDGEEKSDTNVDETSSILEDNSILHEENENVDITRTEEYNKLLEENQILRSKLENAESNLTSLRSELHFKSHELELKEHYIQSLKEQFQAKSKK